MRPTPPIDPPALRVVDAAGVRRALSPRRAVDALEAALLPGPGQLDPARSPARQVIDVPGGQLLVMPAGSSTAAGVKLASVAPGNPARGLPRIQGSYLLLDGATLTPVAVLEGAALTLTRTAAVSALAVRHLAVPGVVDVVVFGTGPQAVAHVQAVCAVRSVGSVRVVGRRPEAVAAAVTALREVVAAAERTAVSDARVTPGSPSDVAAADLVLCCTSSAVPLFDGDLVADGALVVAIGSHEVDRREVPGDLIRRALVVVETVDTAWREAGDIVLATTPPGRRDQVDLLELADVVCGGTEIATLVNTRGLGPRVFKSVGMGWQDLVVASAIVDALTTVT